MPLKIDELPKNSRGRAKKYNFEKLYDGNVWVIVGDGVDFDCEVGSIRQRIYREVADTLNKRVKSTEIEQDGKPALAFQVIDEEPVKRGPRKASANGDQAKDKDKAAK